LAAYLRARKVIREQRRTIADVQAELHALRTLPLEAPPGPGGSPRRADIATPSTDELSQR
jgi:hypothetical protein